MVRGLLSLRAQPLVFVACFLLPLRVLCGWLNCMLRTAFEDWLFWLRNYGSLCFFPAGLTLDGVMWAGMFACCCPCELLSDFGSCILMPTLGLHQLVQELLLSFTEIV